MSLFCFSSSHVRDSWRLFALWRQEQQAHREEFKNHQNNPVVFGANHRGLTSTRFELENNGEWCPETAIDTGFVMTDIL